MEYLYSQTSRAFQEDFGADPDIPDGIRDEDLQVDLEGDEGFEDICPDEPIEFMELEGNDLPSLQEHPAGLPAAESSSAALSAQSQVNDYP